jgi:hypothetical protein
MPREGFQVGREGQVHRDTIINGVGQGYQAQVEYANEETPSLGV